MFCNETAIKGPQNGVKQTVRNRIGEKDLQPCLIVI